LILSWIITNAKKKIPIPEAPPVTIADKPGLISIFFLVVVKILFYWFYNRKGGGEVRMQERRIGGEEYSNGGLDWFCRMARLILSLSRFKIRGGDFF
jgi:hypothetical protein